MQYIAEERIQQRAYQIWMREGCPHGRYAQLRRQAESEITEELRRSLQIAAAPDAG
jgi:hypothetical protein